MPVKSAIVVRDRTIKLNCQYQVQQVKPGRESLEERTDEVVRQLDSDMTGHQKGVIYYRWKKQCEAIAEEIGCGFHYSGMSEKDRLEARSAWVDGRASRWIAATTGLGTGIDIEGIVAERGEEKEKEEDSGSNEAGSEAEYGTDDSEESENGDDGDVGHFSGG
ncbi:recq family helicase [Fusarium beomiforme]|uniref:Recq family helicase n=1 Tax=Fusarium beomiforme TaxID=44412 RepID=A0A9P5A535_9HYPO|nr:recq family helicase [Fusarium beomiforme]